MKRCKYCNIKMPNAHPNRKFCSLKHKNRFHNEHNPRGFYAHLKKVNIEDTFHPQDPYSLGQE